MNKMQHEFKLMDEAFENIAEHLEEMAARWNDWDEEYRRMYKRGRSYFVSLIPALESISEGKLHPKLGLATIEDRKILVTLPKEEQIRVMTTEVPVVDTVTRKTVTKSFGEMTENQREAVIDKKNGRLRSPYQQSQHYTEKVMRALEPPPPRKPVWEWDVIGSGEHMYIDMKSPIKLAIPAKRIREMYLALEAREREHKEVRRGR